MYAGFDWKLIKSYARDGTAEDIRNNFYVWWLGFTAVHGVLLLDCLF